MKLTSLPPPAEPGATPADEVEKERVGKKRLLVVAALFLAVVGGYFGVRFLGAGSESTDAAAMEADVVPVSLRVGGQVLAVRVADNARVKQGDVLVEVDPSEAQARLLQAQGELAAARAQAAAADAQLEVASAGARGGLSTARAQMTTSRAQVGSADAQVGVARAQLARAQVDASKAQADLARASQLVAAGAMPQERLEATQAGSDSAQAALQAATAQLEAAEDARRVAQSRVEEASGAVAVNEPIAAKIANARSSADLAHARVTTAQAAVDLAKLMLSYTTVVAPNDGTIAKLTLRAGQLTSPGQVVTQLVPDTTYVVANFKETQVGRMRPGQHASVEVDSFPGLELQGVVESVAPGTGSRFSMLAPDNASGNFVKVVQRVPVRIRLESVPKDVPVRPGMSAVASVHVGR